MNKQELIEKIGNLDKLYGEKFYVALDDVLDLVKQLDEPGKVQIPQSVADWIEYCKVRKITLAHALYHYEKKKNKRLRQPRNIRQSMAGRLRGREREAVFGENQRCE